MRSINIIDNLYLDAEGVKVKMRNGKLQKVHLRQGNLDGACAVYSTVMVLIMIGAVRYKDIMLGSKKKDGRTGIERFKKEFFELKGLHRDGNTIIDDEYDSIKLMLKRSFSRYVSTRDVPFENDEDMIKQIEEHISTNSPLLISYTFSGGAHAVVAVGMEYENKKPERILCLDPGYATPTNTYWNGVLILNPKSKKYKQKVSKYNVDYIGGDGNCYSVQLSDALEIKKK